MMEERHLREAAGVALAAFSILTVASLVTYSPGDPSFSHAVAGNAVVMNAIGILGAYFADALVQLFGMAAFAIPVFSLALGMSMFYKDAREAAVPFALGGLLFMTSFCAIVYVVWKLDPVYHEAYGGGFLGYVLAEKILIRLVARPGATIISLTILFISVLIITRLSIGQFLKLVARGAVWAYGAALAALPKIFEVVRGLWRPRAAREEPPAAPEKIHAPDITTADDAPKIKKGEKPQIEKPAEEFKARQEKFAFMEEGGYVLPPLSYLSDPKAVSKERSEKELLVNSQILTKKLADFGIEGRVTTVSPGPVITLYEFEPASGVKVSRIVSLADDLAMGLRAVSIRILAPVP